MEQVLTFKGGRHCFPYDGALHDSSKSFTPKTGHQWHLRGVHVRLTTSAVVGNRRMALILSDTTPNVVARFFSPTEQVAGSTHYYTWAPGAAADYATSYVNIPIPDLIIPSGFTILVQDDAGIDPAGDDMYVTLFVDDEVLG